MLSNGACGILDSGNLISSIQYEDRNDLLEHIRLELLLLVLAETLDLLIVI
jgi:hypothetical protein